MPIIFHDILLVRKHLDRKAEKLADEIRRWLENKNIPATIVEAGTNYNVGKTDCVVVLGGDGTILGAARRLAGHYAPIFGINFGRVGFLTASDAVNWQPKLEEAMSGGMQIKNCTAIRWKLSGNGKPCVTGIAANDVVISRGNLARLMAAQITINNERMGLLRSDGLIICTPLGSSGYNISSGGAMLYMDLDIMEFTPICSFLKNITPLVLPAQTIFEIKIAASSADCHLTIDGQEGLELDTGDIVSITGWPGALRFFSRDSQFFERLRTRGFTLEKDVASR